MYTYVDKTEIYRKCTLKVCFNLHYVVDCLPNYSYFTLFVVYE